MSKDYTLVLDDNWDITLNDDGSILTATGAYAIAQKCANAVRLFIRDAYFAQQKGIPHFDIELGQHVETAIPVLTSRIKSTVLAIEGVAECEVSLLKGDNRIMGGIVYITTDDGYTAQAEF